ncbi:hypothetical protein BN2537_13075 [Streptomyces venezuelae]|nr:hypothetical protein BN2537_13075 [Streptomyces venezuelae]
MRDTGEDAPADQADRDEPPSPTRDRHGGGQLRARRGGAQRPEREPAEEPQGQRGTPVLRVEVDGEPGHELTEEGDRPRAPAVEVGEGVPHHVGRRTEHRREEEPAREHRRVPVPPGTSPHEPVHPPAPPGGQQRDERFAHDQPQGHERRGDQHVGRDDPDGGVGDVAEDHRPGHRRGREVGHVGREGARDERGGDERSARGPVAPQPGQDGGGMAQRERQGGLQLGSGGGGRGRRRPQCKRCRTHRSVPVSGRSARMRAEVTGPAPAARRPRGDESVKHGHASVPVGTELA